MVRYRNGCRVIRPNNVAIKKRRLAVAGPTKVIGFKRYMDTAA